ncbi:hypothetical protein BJ508DRAFT_315762 [Ascobolus immersus RN42]|uniref:Uncharacterized protein n=1 Tax=Ascobolus immersus RN42 TaxID=1160509 RepID=A0A3N4HDG1_ASCIM|nr:hypothetical protein BJ508DRAFT_315762 [Ascobolus immersus RN42]
MQRVQVMHEKSKIQSYFYKKTGPPGVQSQVVNRALDRRCYMKRRWANIPRMFDDVEGLLVAVSLLLELENSPDQQAESILTGAILNGMTDPTFYFPTWLSGRSLHLGVSQADLPPFRRIASRTVSFSQSVFKDNPGSGAGCLLHRRFDFGMAGLGKTLCDALEWYDYWLYYLWERRANAVSVNGKVDEAVEVTCGCWFCLCGSPEERNKRKRLKRGITGIDLGVADRDRGFLARFGTFCYVIIGIEAVIRHGTGLTESEGKMSRRAGYFELGLALGVLQIWKDLLFIRARVPMVPNAIW